MSLKGKVVVFTGKCSLSRKEMTEEAEAHGLIVGGSITKKTDLLVSGDDIAANQSSSKYKKALVNDVTILLEEKYRELLAGKAPKTAKKSSGNPPSAKTWLADFSKADLAALLRCANDTQHSYDWSRDQLLEQISSYSFKDLTNSISESLAQLALFSLQLAFEPEEDLSQQKIRITNKLTE